MEKIESEFDFRENLTKGLYLQKFLKNLLDEYGLYDDDGFDHGNPSLSIGNYSNVMVHACDDHYMIDVGVCTVYGYSVFLGHRDPVTDGVRAMIQRKTFEPYTFPINEIESMLRSYVRELAFRKQYLSCFPLPPDDQGINLCS